MGNLQFYMYRVCKSRQVTLWINKNGFLCTIQMHGNFVINRALSSEFKVKHLSKCVKIPSKMKDRYFYMVKLLEKAINRRFCSILGSRK